MSPALPDRDAFHGAPGGASVHAVAPGDDVVVAIDTLVAGVHFPRDADPRDVGHKALAVNLSDLAAMGAAPVSASIAVVADDDAWARAVAAGVSVLAERFGIAPCAARTIPGPRSVTVEAVGRVRRAAYLRRSGAAIGDRVFVTGTLGDAGAGLELALARRRAAPAIERFLLDRLARPEPRVDMGLRAVGLASAAIDVSDGLLQDLGHVADASGVGASVDASRLPVSDALVETCGVDVARRLAATAGDDYELCLCVAPDNAAALEAAAAGIGCGLTAIGRIERGRGVRLLDDDGAEIVVAAGYRHFADGDAEGDA